MAAESNNHEEILTPFYQRASEAEERLARLEDSLSKYKDQSENEEQTKLIGELRLELENAKAEQVAERKKALKEMEDLTDENGKLKYRIIHLVRALHKADDELAAKQVVVTTNDEVQPVAAALDDLVDNLQQLDLVDNTQQLDHVPSVERKSQFNVPEAI